MHNPLRVVVFAAFVCGVLAFPLAAGAGHTTDPGVEPGPLGHIEEPAVLGGFGGANPDIQTDITFWGKYAYQGNWDGFNIRNIKSRGTRSRFRERSATGTRVTSRSGTTSSSARGTPRPGRPGRSAPA